MLPIFALVGRPNVGKSTIFNILTRTRDALVADQPGLTRDRQYGHGVVGDNPYMILDTGGLSGDENRMDQLIESQVWKAVDEADVILFVVDGREGLTAFDEDIANRLRRSDKPCIVVVNKAEGQDPELIMSDFYALGLGNIVPVSASHNQGFIELVDEAFSHINEEEFVEAIDEEDDIIRLAVFGRPNAGKSTLINRILGEERVLASDVAGTTRDSIEIPFTMEDRDFILIDTAGVRRRARVSDKIEKFSVLKSLDAIEKANVVVFVFDAEEGLSEQDATLLGYVLDSGKALVLAVNKWDTLENDDKEWLKQEFDRRFAFVDFTKPIFISALRGTGVSRVLQEAIKAYDSSMQEFSTSELSDILEDAVRAHQPPMEKGFAPKLRFAHQGGKNPPRIIIHGNRTQYVKDSYVRYLSKTYRETLGLYGTPVRINFRGGDNPYAGKAPSPTKKEIKRAGKVRYGKPKK